MTKYLFTLVLIIFPFLVFGCQEKLQSGKQTAHTTQVPEPIPTISEKPTQPMKPIIPTKPTKPIVETGPTEPSEDAEQEETLSFIKNEGILKVKEGEKVCLLADDAIDYETFVSPDATLIAVETLLMSNLQIVRVYKKDAEGCFHPLKNKLSTKLWRDLSEQEGFILDDVSHPRMKFLKWIDNKQIEIGLSGELENKVLDANLSCDLELLIQPSEH